MKLPARLTGPSARFRRYFLFALVSSAMALLLVVAQLALERQPSVAQTATLRQLASARGIFVGAAVDANALANEAIYRTVLAREYSSVTAENAMKWGSVEPNRGQFNWAQADALMSFAQANNQVVRGHTLVWHDQNPGWISSLSAADLRTALLDHISTEMGRYRGRIQAWDVVNEAFNEDGSRRQSIWQTMLGDGYIADAFRAARAADPAAKLYINDFNVEGMNAKSNALFNLVSTLRQQGVPIDGVGLQGHFILNSLPSGIQQNIQRFANLGVDVSLTEVDIRMQLPADTTKLSQQASNYSSVLNACLAVPRCVSFTTWGFTDAHSWVPGTFSGQGAALPFNENFQPKPAYNAMIQALGGSGTTTTAGQTTTTGATTTTRPTTTTGPTTTGPAGSCQLTWAVQSQWQDGFVANLTIRNTSNSAINGWTLAWAFPGTQRITNLWNATWTQTGQNVTTSSNADWNRVIPVGGSYTFGFQASYSGSNSRPSAFTLNGTTCTIA
jgi:endo-1,4-beta-xylanase